MSNPTNYDHIREEPYEFVKRLQDAVDGVLGGIAITPSEAHEILLWTVLKQVPDDADRMRLSHDHHRREALRPKPAEGKVAG